MAGVKKKPQATVKEKAEWIGFLEFRLTDAELEELDAWKPKPQDIWDAVDSACTAGFRFTLSYNNRTKLASCTIVDDDASRKTGGYALSSADENGALALKMATFKHLKLATDWTSLLGHDAPKGKRG